MPLAMSLFAASTSLCHGDTMHALLLRHKHAPSFHPHPLFLPYSCDYCDTYLTHDSVSTCLVLLERAFSAQNSCPVLLPN